MRRQIRHEARDVLVGMVVIATLGALIGAMLALAV